jgi:nicotinate-nucleotide adenylyltransferase
MRIGIFGGTFNPIHYGHLLVADEISERLQCDQLLFVPAGCPPHKAQAELAPARDRKEMVRLAISGHPTFALSTLELDHPGVSYSVETAAALAREHGPGANLFFLIGGETFLDLPSWKSPERLADLSTLTVVPRTSSPLDPEGPAARKVLTLLGNRRWNVIPSDGPLPEIRKGDVLLVNATSLPISGSVLRRRAREGRSLRFRVPPDVDAYIRARGLYR